MHKVVLSIGLAATVLLSGGVDVFAQSSGKSIRIRDFKGRTYRSPNFVEQSSDIKRNQNTSQRWYRCELEFETLKEWTDDLTIRFYVMLEDKNGRGKDKFKLLKKEITYINIPRGNRHLSVAYIPPQVLARYSQPKGTAVEVLLGGEIMDIKTIPATNTKWWTQYTPVNGLLLNRLETPFSIMNYDDYNMIKAAP